ncbi:unnamed protein product [Citrullus colocynthis]|uniref:Uncharacterized protein n=1 Tax=Citrullus colocynthis TaxID=252529 RepID=A0ABP0YIR7_9ROSI
MIFLRAKGRTNVWFRGKLRIRGVLLISSWHANRLAVDLRFVVLSSKSMEAKICWCLAIPARYADEIEELVSK